MSALTRLFWNRLAIYLWLGCCCLPITALALTPATTKAPSTKLVTAPATLNLGILNWNQTETAVADSFTWQATLEALHTHLPHTQIQIEYLNLDGLATALASQSLDYLITNPGHYVELAQTYQLAPLASLKNSWLEQPQQAVGSVVLVSVQRTDLNTWQDLTQHTLGAVSLDAFGGFQLIWDEMHKANLNPLQDIQHWHLSGFPMQQLFDLLAAGTVDAIITRSCLAENLAAQGQINLAHFKALEPKHHPGFPCLVSSQLYPDWPFLSTGTHSLDQQTQVLQALLQGGVTTPAQWSAPLSYQPVYELFARLRIGPFAPFPAHPWLNFFHQHLEKITLGFALLLLLVVHYLRVNYLVKKRSQELILAMQESQLKQQELEHLSRFAVMGELATGLAHELNQPLTAILNYAQGSQRLLHSSISTTQQASLVEANNLIASQAQRAAAIIRNLRAFIRKEKTQPELLQPAQLLREALSFVQAHLHSHNINLQLQLKTDLPLIYANKVEFLQIMVNLLNNSIDAMQNCNLKQLTLQAQRLPKDTATFTTSTQSVASTPKTQQDSIQIILTDTGEGLDNTTATQAFEPFFTTRSQGLGLGLSLSRKLAQTFNAQLHLYPAAVTNSATANSTGTSAVLIWPAATTGLSGAA